MSLGLGIANLGKASWGVVAASAGCWSFAFSCAQ